MRTLEANVGSGGIPSCRPRMNDPELYRLSLSQACLLDYST